ncbi:prenyltransferase [Sinomonas terrae]|uniref:Prenyltransferase n=1 Tax=Sinomonas terrae TaxID=2908838 RepID=A0ABS9U6H3_9MICC|nr:prenyltransferase [Sinomonas terrae]MCH6472298.1 prenyltransferase [Sinomonas terrae]
MTLALPAPRGLIAAVVVSSRPLSWVNTAYPFAAAYFLSSRSLDWRLLVGTVFFLVPYNAAMYGTNDVFDYESDLRNPRKGGAEGGVLDPSLHLATLWLVWGSCVPFVALLVLGGSPGSWAALALSLFAVAAYSVPVLRFKERPVLDSLTSSTHFVSPAVYGLALAGARPSSGVLAALGAFFAWGVASHAFGAVQDIVPDREARIASVATLFGARATVRFAVVCYLAAGALLLLGSEGLGRWAGLLVLPYAANAAPFLKVSDAESGRARAGWRRFLWLNYLTGFLVTLVLIAIGLGL